MEIKLEDLIPWGEVGNYKVFFIRQDDIQGDWGKPVLCLCIDFGEPISCFTDIFQRSTKFCWIKDIKEDERVWEKYRNRIREAFSEEELNYVIKYFNEQLEYIQSLDNPWRYRTPPVFFPSECIKRHYPVTTLCGSTRFKEEFMEAQKKLTLEDRIVISVGLFGHSGDNEVWTEGTKEMLDDMHKRKIDMADSIFVINKNGYIGESTRSEIEYAKEQGKKIEYLEAIQVQE